MLPKFLPNFSLMFLIDMFLIKKRVFNKSFTNQPELRKNAICF